MLNSELDKVHSGQVHACRSCEATNSFTCPSERRRQLAMFCLSAQPWQIDRVALIGLSPRPLCCFVGIRWEHPNTLHAIYVQSGCCQLLAGHLQRARHICFNPRRDLTLSCGWIHVTGRPALDVPDCQLDRCLAYRAQQTILVGNSLHSLLVVSNVTHHSGPVLCGNMSAQLGKTHHRFLHLLDGLNLRYTAPRIHSFAELGKVPRSQRYWVRYSMQSSKGCVRLRCIEI